MGDYHREKLLVSIRLVRDFQTFRWFMNTPALIDTELGGIKLNGIFFLID